ncbi:hypothetical protein QL285_062551 [Trifolium repens]|nr:hypothetical protein QL285_062551 [Trifolium repens]
MEKYGDGTVSSLVGLIHFGLSQHFLFTITKNKDVIRKFESLVETLLFMVCFAVPSGLMLYTLSDHKKIVTVVVFIWWLGRFMMVYFPNLFEWMITGIKKFKTWILGRLLA